MRKHNLLLSLLSLFIAVFMTACGSSTTNDAKLPSDGTGGGGDQGGVNTPSLYFTYEVNTDTRTVNFTGNIANANEEDYEFVWDYGDGNVAPDGLTTSHVYTAYGSYGVTLTANPKDPENTPALPNATTIVTLSESGLVANSFRYSAVTGMRYEFQASATATDGSDVLYTWDFGDGTIVDNTTVNTYVHEFGKYNTTFTVQVYAYHAVTGRELKFPSAEITTPGITAELVIDSVPGSGLEKTISVNFYDVTGALIHGSQGAGEVTGLSNVNYTWTFSDNTPAFTGQDRVISHTFPSTGEKEYTVSVVATSDTFNGTVSASGTTSTTLTYGITSLTAQFSDTYALQLTVDASGDGGGDFGNGEAKYVFTFPGDVTVEKTVSHSGGVGSVQVVQDLPTYYGSYKVGLVVKSSDGETVLGEKELIVERPTFNYVLNGPNNGTTYFAKTFSVTPAQGSKVLKEAYFDYNFGEGSSRSNDGTASFTFSGPGTKTVNVSINSPLLTGTGITVPSLSTSFTINADVTINSLQCTNDGTAQDFLQYTCRVGATGTSGTTLQYTWYADGAVDTTQTGTSFTKKFGKYNEDHTVKVEVSVLGSSAAPKSQTFGIKTPNVQVSLTGATSANYGEYIQYTATTKVVDGNSSKVITLTNPTYAFKIIGYADGGETINSNVWSRAFWPSDSEFSQNGGSVSRTITVDVTGSNLEGTATSSNQIRTVITKLEADVNNFNKPVITCTQANSINPTRQTCKMTVTVKDNFTADSTDGNFSDYTAKFTYNGTTKTMPFNNLKLTAGAQGTTNTFTVDFNWPNYGDISTGDSRTASYQVSGEFYKNTNTSEKLTANAVNINITLSGDYVLFPLPEKLYTGNGGGSGYRIGTWSCGYKETYSERDPNYSQTITSINTECGSSGSASGQTFNVSTFFNSDRTAKEALTLTWKMRLRTVNGIDNTQTLKTVNLNKGQALTDDNLRFHIADAIKKAAPNGYIGSAYNGSTNVFYVEISGANLTKSARIWYNGTNKTGNGNRLQRITPIAVGSNAFCSVGITQSGGMWNDRYAHLYIKRSDYTYDGAKLNTFGSYDKTLVIPTSGTYLIKQYFTSTVYNNKGSSTGIEGKLDRVAMSTSGIWAGILSAVVYQLDIPEVGPNVPDGVSIPGDITSGTATMYQVITDMLAGSGSAQYRNYYQPQGCGVEYSLY